MFSRKLEREERPSEAEELFGKDAAAWAARTARPGPAVVPPVADATPRADSPEQVPPLERRSYRILRGRVENLRSLSVINRQGQKRVFPWNYFGGASMDQPGELVLIFDGPEGSSTITVSGKDLDVELLPGIEANRVEWICELDDLTAAAVAKGDPTEPMVRGAWIVGGGREWSRAAAPARGGRHP